MNEDMIIEVLVPKEAPEEVRDKLFDAVADAAYDVQPEDREDWDIIVSAGPASEVAHIRNAREGIIVALRASRAFQAGAAFGVPLEAHADFAGALADAILDHLIEVEKL